MIVNLGIFVATVIAAIIAWRGVGGARLARDEANAAAERATAAAESSAESQERLATATEEHVRIVQEATSPREPWRLTKVGQHRWELTNLMGVNVDMVHLTSRPEKLIQLEADDWCDVADGTSIFFQFGGGFTDPASLNVTVNWRQPGRNGREAWTRSIS